MPSKQSEAVRRRWEAGRRAMLEPDAERPDDESWGDLTAEPREVDYQETEAGGRPAMWAVPKRARTDRVLLCLHGGGFVSGSIYTHRKMFGHLAKAAGARALLVSYRLLPEGMYPKPVDDVAAAYRWLLDQGIAAGHIAFAGDSVGGWLAVTVQLRARDQGLPAAVRGDADLAGHGPGSDRGIVRDQPGQGPLLHAGGGARADARLPGPGRRSA
jgi:epsilon-lactone hydrolase